MAKAIRMKNEGMTLCLGIYMRILMKCCRSGVSQRQMISTLLGTIDPNNRCSGSESEGDQDHFVSKLMNCKINLPASGSTITNALPLARSSSTGELKEKFAPVINLLDNDKRRNIVGALYEVIANDSSLKSQHQELFKQCMGDTVENVVSSHRVNFAKFLAGILLYVVLTNDNKRGTQVITQMKKWDIAREYSEFDIVFTQSSEASSLSNWKYPNGLANYMIRLKKVYNEIPTLLNNREPFKPFRDYYVPNDIIMRIKNLDNKDDYATIKNVTLDKIIAKTHCAILSGDGGLGKSMMMRNLLLSCVDEYERLGIIPFFITLKDYNNNYENITAYICDMLSGMWPELDAKSFEEILEHGIALLLLDGLDEMRMDNFVTFVQKLNKFMMKYSDSFFVISSRPYSNFHSFHGFSLLRLQHFTKEQALELIDRYNYFSHLPKIQKKFRDLVDSRLYQTHKEFSDNPLLLSIMMFVFKTEAEIPSEKYKFYERAYEVLSSEHDASKDLYVRHLTTNLNADQFATCFAYFCAASYADGNISFSHTDLQHYIGRLKDKIKSGIITELTLDEVQDVDANKFAYDSTNNLCLMYKEAFSYNFIHRSFQEYFCARYFHSLLDDNLQLIIPIFDTNDINKKNDLTLPMLFDMKPSAVERYVIVPYLKKLIDECEEKDGIWTFLDRLYPDYQFTDGDIDMSDEYCSPKSNLYSFIHKNYNIPDIYVDIDKVPQNFALVIDEMLYVYEAEEVMWENEFRDWYYANFINPAMECGRYVKLGGYTEYKDCETEHNGYLYEFDWEDIKCSKNRELIKFIENEESPFMKEYMAIKKLLGHLQAKLQQKTNTSGLSVIL